jgi:hypothetical protein
LGVNENAALTSSMTVSPNPSFDFAQLNYEIKNSSDVTISIVDLLGQVFYSQSYEKQQPGTHNFNLNLQTFQKGVYFVKVQTDGGVGVKKIVKAN